MKSELMMNVISKHQFSIVVDFDKNKKDGYYYQLKSALSQNLPFVCEKNFNDSKGVTWQWFWNKDLLFEV